MSLFLDALKVSAVNNRTRFIVLLYYEIIVQNPVTKKSPYKKCSREWSSICNETFISCFIVFRTWFSVSICCFLNFFLCNSIVIHMTTKIVKAHEKLYNSARTIKKIVRYYWKYSSVAERKIVTYNMTNNLNLLWNFYEYR